MMKGIFILFMLLMVAVNGCSNKNNRKGSMITTKENMTSQHKYFLSDSKPIEYIKNTATGNYERYIISFDITKHISQDSFTLYKVNVTDGNDSLYMGLKDDVVYMYDGTKKYLDKTFILNLKDKNYYSFFCGNDYRIDSSSIKNDVVYKENSYIFYMSKLTNQQGNDYFYYEGESPKKIFRKIVFSKKRGIISAELYDRENKQIYITTELDKEP